MDYSIDSRVKALLLLLLLLTLCYWLTENNTYGSRINPRSFYSSLNLSRIIEIFQTKTTITTFSSNYTIITHADFTAVTSMITTINRTIGTTGIATTPTTIDPAELLLQRSPLISQYSNNLPNTTLAVFVFHTRHSILANLQLFLIRKLAINLIAVELFLDGPASEEMRQITDLHKAGLHSFPSALHTKGAEPSTRNAKVVNWAVAVKGKNHLRNGTAVLLLDGDIFPLSPFDATTLYNSHAEYQFFL